jgi:hypothetical protein
VALILAALLALAAATPAFAQDAERVLMARVRFTTDAAVARGCAFLAAVADDSLKDLRRKIVRAGGDTAVVSFPPEDVERVHARVYRCPAASAAPPPPPPGVPPPPAGAPPPGPPPGSAPPAGPPPPLPR